MSVNIPTRTENETAGAGFAQGDSRFDTRAFRSALGTFATGVAVVTTLSADDTRIGITVNSFSSVSLVPPLVLISVGKNNHSFPHFLECRYFAVNVLSAAQKEISRRFAHSAADKWRDVPLRYGAFGCPLLDSALSIFECEVEHRYDAGDHVILLGKIIAFDFETEGTPLLFFRGGYGHISEA